MRVSPDDIVKLSERQITSTSHPQKQIPALLHSVHRMFVQLNDISNFAQRHYLQYLQLSASREKKWKVAEKVVHFYAFMLFWKFDQKRKWLPITWMWKLTKYLPIRKSM